MGANLTDIGKTALALSPGDRARLAVMLISSLEESAESPEEIEKLWLDEAQERAHELETGKVTGIPAEEVFAKLRAGRR